MESYNGDSGFDRKIPPERVINLKELMERGCVPPSFTELLRACEERNKKKPRNRYKFMETGDATTRRREIMTLRANYLNRFLLNNNNINNKITPIAAPAPATLAKDSDQLTKLKDLMLRWGKLEEAQSQLDRDRAKLIQEQAQLVASWS